MEQRKRGAGERQGLHGEGGRHPGPSSHLPLEWQNVELAAGGQLAEWPWASRTCRGQPGVPVGPRVREDTRPAQALGDIRTASWGRWEGERRGAQGLVATEHGDLMVPE